MTQGAATSTGAGGEVYRYKGLFDGFRHIIKHEGPTAVYKGLGIVLLGAAPAQGLFFYGMTTVQKKFSPKYLLQGLHTASFLTRITSLASTTAVAAVPRRVVYSTMTDAPC